MDRRMKLLETSVLFFFFFFFFLVLLSSSLFSILQIPLANANPTQNKHSSSSSVAAKENPFTPKASLIRYWNKQIHNKLPKPNFLLAKASPLSSLDAALYTKLATHKSLPSRLSAFCASANLMCPAASSESEIISRAKKPQGDANFASYLNRAFSNYGASRLGGEDVFKNYSDGSNFATGSFTKYSRSSTGHGEGFTSYASDGNVASSNFTSYAAGATGGSGNFISYMPRVNVPDLGFTSYDASGNHHELKFSSYVDDTNSGNQGFTTYAKNGNGVPVQFSSYGTTSNVIGSSFTGYNELGNGANDSFKSYSNNANNPSNSFKSYGSGVNGGIDSFTSYRDAANSGTDTFQSYGRSSNSEKASFVNYGKSFNGGTDTFREYGRRGIDQETSFKGYGLNNTFKDYAKKGVTFALYTKTGPDNKQSHHGSGKSVNFWVEEGKFFREAMLKEGNTMRMPDIRDKLPERSFLPRVILSQLPFSSHELPEIKHIFNVQDNSTMEGLIVHSLGECERAPSPGETKRCVGSIEDMIDLAVSVLGHDVTVKTTSNVEGSKRNVMIGKVKGVNGGRVTKSVSCHQSMYPYLLYYCHSVPKVRVYEAEILDAESKVKVNHGVAVCHLDTSAWSPGHGAFVALGSSPGLIEVCHWIFENDMTWTVTN